MSVNLFLSTLRQFWIIPLKAKFVVNLMLHNSPISYSAIFWWYGKFQLTFSLFSCFLLQFSRIFWDNPLQCQNSFRAIPRFSALMHILGAIPANPLSQRWNSAVNSTNLSYMCGWCFRRKKWLRPRCPPAICKCAPRWASLTRTKKLANPVNSRRLRRRPSGKSIR